MTAASAACSARRNDSGSPVRATSFRLLLGVAHRGAAGRGADAVDRGLHDDLQQADAVEAGGERLADAADRLLQALALALELLQARLELARHRVELLAEGGELVVAVGGHGDREVAAAEALGGHQQALDLRLQAPRDGDREDEGEDEEADEGGGGEERRRGRRIGGVLVGQHQADGHVAADRGRLERPDAVVGAVDGGGALVGQVGRRGGAGGREPAVACSTTTSAPVSFEIRFAYCSGESMATAEAARRLLARRRRAAA